MLWLLINVKTVGICIRRFNAMPSKLTPSFTKRQVKVILRNIVRRRMEKPNKLVAGFANQWADTFYFASTAYMRKIIITGKRLAIGEKKYILRQCIIRKN